MGIQVRFGCSFSRICRSRGAWPRPGRGLHFVADLTLGYGEVVFDYMAQRLRGAVTAARGNRS